MTTTLLMPTLNEVEGLKAVSERIDRSWVDQILVADGNSRDGTADLARELGYEVYVQKKKGLRFAYLEVMDLIRSDVVITFSPDGNSIPELIPDLCARMNEGLDMVIVSRYAEGAKSEDDDWITGFGNAFFTGLTNILYGSSYTDAFVMFRAWRKQVFFDLDMHREESYATEERLFRTIVGCEPLLSVRAAKAGLKCADIPGDEPPRIGGDRKLQVLRWGAAYLYEILREKFAWKYRGKQV